MSAPIADDDRLRLEAPVHRICAAVFRDSLDADGRNEPPKITTARPFDDSLTVRGDAASNRLQLSAIDRQLAQALTRCRKDCICDSRNDGRSPGFAHPARRL